MSRWELKNQAKGALKDNFGSKMLLFIIPIIAGILGGGNGVKQTTILLILIVFQVVFGW